MSAVQHAEPTANREASPSPHGPNGRDAHGKFTQGNPGGHGNPFARQVAALRSALVRAVSEQDIDDIAMALIIQAKAGNVPAAKLLLAYCIGKPGETVQPDRVDIDEWQVVQQGSAKSGDVEQALKGLHAPIASNIVSLALPALGEEFAGKLRDRLIRMDEAPDNGISILGRRSDARTSRSAPSTNGHNGKGAGHTRKPPSR